MSVIQRVKELIKSRNISNSQLGKAANIHRNTIGRMLSSETEPNVKVIVGLKALIPALNLNWIILGQGEMLLGEHKKLEGREVDKLRGRIAGLEEKYEKLDKKYGQIKPAMKDLNESIMEMGKKYDEMDLVGTITKVIEEIYGGNKE